VTLAVGLMSGTSLDGVDAALVSIRPRGVGYCVETVRFQTHPFERALHEALLAALPPNAGSLRAVAQLHHELGIAYAQAAVGVAQGERIAFAASHGQTVWHDGSARVTLQVGDPFLIREAIEATVCYDFRSADCAAGGQGAPLVARVDALLLRSPDEDRVALNLGGIANVTLLRRGAAPEETIAFDTGPGNMLVDAFVRERTKQGKHFDAGGAFAAAGEVDRRLLEAMLGDAYFAVPPPKTTGREYFGAHFLSRYARDLGRLSLEDGAATLTELTAASVAGAVDRAGLSNARLIVSGGGARNPTLLARIAARLERARVERSDCMGLPADAKEAIAFAVLGYETLRGRAANLPAATGASRSVVLGAIAPYELGKLLGEVAAECAAVA
jgi:anhydro-N-acetylmuramic acid kinase